MIIRINSSNNIKEAAKKIFSAADKKGTIPILSNFLLEAEGNSLKLTATNLEIGASVIVEDCEVVEAGKTTVNAQKFTKLISNLSDMEMEISLNENKLLVKTAKSKFSLATLEAEEFPEITVPENFDIAIPTDEFEKAIKKTAYAASKDEARYILTGVFLKSFGDKLHAVATDGHRLALYEIKVNAPEFQALIPRKAISEVRKILKDGDEVLLALLENKIYFKVGNTLMWSSLIEGEYPDYLAVIPGSNPLCVEVDKEELLSALKEISAIYDKEEVRAVIVNLTSGNMKLTAKKLDGEVDEEAEVILPADYSQDEFEIGFNINHLLESVSSFDESLIKIYMDSPTSPVLVVGDEEPQLKNVIMPMKV
ncbi:MAG: DNA polymerase III subunit beta [Desulfurobacteriaceae bacterium]